MDLKFNATETDSMIKTKSQKNREENHHFIYNG